MLSSYCIIEKLPRASVYACREAGEEGIISREKVLHHVSCDERAARLAFRRSLDLIRALNKLLSRLVFAFASQYRHEMRGNKDIKPASSFIFSHEKLS